MLQIRLELSTRDLQHCIIPPPYTALIITLTSHAFIAALLEHIASEMSAALKRKMFGVSDGGELVDTGHNRKHRSPHRLPVTSRLAYASIKILSFMLSSTIPTSTMSQNVIGNTIGEFLILSPGFRTNSFCLRTCWR
jgi:hypothetical protein